MSNLSSSRVPAVSPLDDAFLGDGRPLSFLCWIKKNWVTIPVSSPAPSEERRHPPFLESSDQGGSLQAPGRKSSTQEKSKRKAAKARNNSEQVLAWCGPWRQGESGTLSRVGDLKSEVQTNP